MPGIIYEDIIAITGHREYMDPGSVFRGLDQLRAREYLFGGARGTDTDALNYIAKTQPGTKRTVIVPDRVINQPSVSRMAIRKHATRVIELKNRGPDRYMIRNYALVDRSNHLRAFYDGRGKGGTFQTIEYARRTGKPYSITRVVSVDVNKDLDLTFEEYRARLKAARRNGESIPGTKHIACMLMNKLSPGQREILIADLREFESTA